jgi:hypothetical protein
VRQLVWQSEPPYFLTVDDTFSTLTLVTSDSLDIGVYPVAFTVSLLDYPTIASITKSFALHILDDCEISSISFAPSVTQKVIIWGPAVILTVTMYPVHSSCGSYHVELVSSGGLTID